jgi:hypothetical protein
MTKPLKDAQHSSRIPTQGAHAEKEEKKADIAPGSTPSPDGATKASDGSEHTAASTYQTRQSLKPNGALVPAASNDLTVPKSGVRISTLPDKVSFFDIDWKFFFEQECNLAYETAGDYSDYLSEDGSYNFSRIEKERGWVNAGRFANDDGSPNIEKIIEGINDNARSYFILFAIGDGSKLENSDKEKINEALLNRCVRQLESGQLTDLFSLIEVLFPALGISFQILEEKLPRILNKEIVTKAPNPDYCQDSEEFAARFVAQLKKEGFEGEDLAELNDQIVKYGTLAGFWRKMALKKAFKLKSGDWARVKNDDGPSNKAISCK